MITLKKIILIGVKDGMIRFSNPVEWPFFIVLPIVFTFVLSTAFVDSNKETLSNRIAVVDLDQKELSTRIIELLKLSPEIQVELMPSDNAKKSLESGDIQGILELPKGMESAFLQDLSFQIPIELDTNDENKVLIRQQIGGILQMASVPYQITQRNGEIAKKLRSFNSLEEENTYKDSSFQDAVNLFNTVETNYEVASRDNSNNANNQTGVSQQAIGSLVTWVLIPLLGTSELFARERRYKTVVRFFSTPSNGNIYLIGTIFGQLVLGIVQIAILIGFGTIVLGVQYARNPVALALMLLGFALASVAMGTMLGTFVRSEKQANSLSILVGMLLAMLGGAWFPFEIFPSVAQQTAKLLPTYHAIFGLQKVVINNAGVYDIVPEFSILLLFTFVFFIIGVSRFTNKANVHA